MVDDTTKAVLYSSGSNMVLGMDLNSTQTHYSKIKISNSQPSELEIDVES